MFKSRRYRGVFLCCLAIGGMNANAKQDFDPSRASIDELRVALDSGRLSSRQLVSYYLERIARFDKHGPHINALISLNPRVLEQAAESDARRNVAKHKGKLYGIPFIAKDNFDTAGLATTGGSAVLARSLPSRDAAVVQRLLEQGALLIGKANMSELAASYGRLGYSSAGGLTVNPYDIARNVSGSSSGSAAAVAADFSTFAIGTDTSGSLRGPASVAGLVGVRPTFGLISRAGVIPLSLTFDTAGAVTRTVEDLMIVVKGLIGADPQDAATLQQTGIDIETAQAYLLKRARLGVITNFRGGNSEIDGIEQKTLAHLRRQGAVLVQLELPAQFENLWDSVLAPVGEAEFKAQFERYLQTLAPTQPKTLSQFIDISASPAIAGLSTPVNPALIEALRKADAGELTDSPAYIHILTEVIPKMRAQLRTLMSANNLDALVFSTMSCPASPRFDRTDARYACASKDPYDASYVASVVGYPEITVPAGQISGDLPYGFSFVGLPYSEAKLLGLADALQKSLPRLRPPQSVKE